MIPTDSPYSVGSAVSEHNFLSPIRAREVMSGNYTKYTRPLDVAEDADVVLLLHVPQEGGIPDGDL